MQVTFLMAPLFWGIELIQLMLMLVTGHAAYLSRANGHRHPATNLLWLLLALMPLQWVCFNVGAFIACGLMAWLVLAPLSKYLVVAMWRIAGYDPFTGEKHKRVE